MWPFGARSFGVPQDDKPRSIAAQHLLLLLILLAATGLRLYHLNAKSFWYDELASIELACGRGYARFALPTDRLITDPPNLTDLTTAAPLRSLWYSESQGHVPPLYELLLRLWGDVFGLSQASARAFSLVASVAAIAVFFLAVRELSDVTTALWAALIMALAGPQIQFAQEARGYALLLLTGLIAAAALVRIERRGPSLPREATLVAGLLAMSLTHYFAVGTLVALAVYAAVRLKGRVRRRVVACFLVAGALWIPLGAPLALRQSGHVNDRAATDFVRDDDSPGHVSRTLARTALLPVRYITEPMRRATAMAAVGCAAFVLAVLLPIRRPDLLLWGLWLLLTIAPIVLLDLVRQTKHLEFIRYTLLASPALYALTAAALSSGRSPWERHYAPAAIALACVLALPAAYESWWKADWRSFATTVDRARRSDDVLVFVDAPDYQLFAPSAYVHLDYYARGSIRAIALLTRAPDEALWRELHAAPGVLVIASTPEDADRALGGPATTLTPLAYEPGAARAWRLTFRSRDPGSSGALPRPPS